MWDSSEDQVLMIDLGKVHCMTGITLHWRHVYTAKILEAHGSHDGPSFAYSLPVHYFHTRRDRVASLTTCRLHGAAIRRASPLGPGRALTSPRGWNTAGQLWSQDLLPYIAKSRPALSGRVDLGC